jgi:hypothetical protein
MTKQRLFDKLLKHQQCKHEHEHYGDANEGYATNKSKDDRYSRGQANNPIRITSCWNRLHGALEKANSRR